MEFNANDFRGLAWLFEMAARGCLHENKSKTASQMFQHAAECRKWAEDARRHEAAHRIAAKAVLRPYARSR